MTPEELRHARPAIHERTTPRMTIEAAVTVAIAVLAALAAFALTAAVVTLGTVAFALFATGVIVGWLLPRPRP